MIDAMLSPYRVLDLSDEKGSICGKLLGDLGADVIKIEKPGGDACRSLGPFYHDIHDPEKSLLWFAYNGSKRGMTLDIEKREDRATFKELVKTADFLVESFRPGYMASLQLDYPTLEGINRRLIMASITPFGQSGPYKDYKAPDIVALAMGGLMAQNGYSDRAPLRCCVDQAYFHSGMQAAVGMLIAHYYRQRSGVGQHIDVSVHESVLPTLWNPVQEWDMAKTITTRRGARFFRYGGQYIYPCKDGFVVWILQVGVIGRRTGYMVDWMDSEGMAGELRDIRWEDMDMEYLVQNPDLLEKWQKSVARFLLTHTRKELYDGGEKWGVIVYPVNTIANLLNNEQLEARRFWVEVEHSELNESLTYPGTPFIASETTCRISRRAPLIGEHNEDILRELREYTRLDSSHLMRTTPTSEQKDALKGLKVADFSWYGQAPFATKYLADHGATVIKVESMQRVDITRTIHPYSAEKPGVNRSAVFTMYNSSKYSLALNLNHPKGIEVAKKLVAWCDIVVENFLPGAMKKWGLDYDHLKKIKSDVIMVSASVQGQTGPHANRAGGGLFVPSLAGFTPLIGWRDRPPLGFGVPYTDFVSPWYLAVAVLSALDYRDRTGKGQYIDISQFESSVNFLEPAILDYTVNNRLWSADGNRHASAAPHGAYPCLGNDRWCVIAVFSDVEWITLCGVIGKPELANDHRFATLQARKSNEDELDRLIEQWTIRHSAEEITMILQKNGVPAGVVANGKDLFEDPQLNHRHHFWMLDHPEMGVTAYEAPPFRLSKTPLEMKRAPLLGEHTEYICREILRIPDDEFVVLLNEGVFE